MSFDNLFLWENETNAYTYRKELVCTFKLNYAKTNIFKGKIICPKNSVEKSRDNPSVPVFQDKT